MSKGRLYLITVSTFFSPGSVVNYLDNTNVLVQTVQVRAFCRVESESPKSLAVAVSLLAPEVQVLDMPVDPNEPTYCLCHQVCYYDLRSLHSLSKYTETPLESLRQMFVLSTKAGGLDHSRYHENQIQEFLCTSMCKRV